jgi:hypothetical protein
MLFSAFSATLSALCVEALPVAGSVQRDPRYSLDHRVTLPGLAGGGVLYSIALQRLLSADCALRVLPVVTRLLP